MDDRTLLERAAKAAGLDALFRMYGWDEIGDGAFMDANEPPTVWNPLTDDGDNARLRRALRIVVQWFPTDVAAMHWSADGIGRSWAEPYGNDHGAAERRAVVRAAASMAGE